MNPAEIVAETVHQTIDTADTFEEIGEAVLVALKRAGFRVTRTGPAS